MIITDIGGLDLQYKLECTVMTNILQLKNVYAGLEKKELLHGISLNIKPGETHVLMGPNGAGKSTLGHIIMGNPSYEITDGQILFEGEDITELSSDKRARKGIFLSFQSPIEVPGITLSNFLRSVIESDPDRHAEILNFKDRLEENMKLLKMDPKYAKRDLNVGFSGGEKKKAEILQLLMLNPKLAILDETDSGLDVDAMKTVLLGIKQFQDDKTHAMIIITHNTKIAEIIHFDKIHVLVDGKIAKSGGPEIIDEINNSGFEKYLADKK